MTVRSSVLVAALAVAGCADDEEPLTAECVEEVIPVGRHQSAYGLPTPAEFLPRFEAIRGLRYEARGGEYDPVDLRVSVEFIGAVARETTLVLSDGSPWTCHDVGICIPPCETPPPSLEMDVIAVVESGDGVVEGETRTTLRASELSASLEVSELLSPEAGVHRFGHPEWELRTFLSMTTGRRSSLGIRATRHNGRPPLWINLGSLFF